MISWTYHRRLRQIFPRTANRSPSTLDLFLTTFPQPYSVEVFSPHLDNSNYTIIEVNYLTHFEILNYHVQERYGTIYRRTGNGNKFLPVFCKFLFLQSISEVMQWALEAYVHMCTRYPVLTSSVGSKMQDQNLQKLFNEP